jgi:hypothetical protein
MVNYIEELKYFISLAVFILIIYPFKTFIIPFWLFILDNATMFWSGAIILVGLYLYDFNAGLLVSTLIHKLINEDFWIYTWFFSPQVDILSRPISPADVVLFFLGCVIVTKLYKLVKVSWVHFRRVFGDILIVMLWGYYKLRGLEENSMMLITSDEAKGKIWMYILIIVVIILSICLIIGPNLAMATFFKMNTTTVDPITIGNASLDLSILNYAV